MFTPELTREHPAAQAAAFLAASHPQVLVLQLAQGDPTRRMREEVSVGLGEARQRWVPPTYLYDAVGSAIYEEITRLPEYYPTRTEAALLQTIAPDLAERVGAPQIIELGSGSSTKTRVLLDAFRDQGKALTYVPIDVSHAMLTGTAHQLVDEYLDLRVLGLAGEYEDALDTLPHTGDRLVLFLGGTIGNFTPQYQGAFFRRLAGLMDTGQRLLLGFDRRPHSGKATEVIRLAYNDDQGVTARFNLNMLSHLNWALGADFNPGAWFHQAIYNCVEHQIEMYLVSQEDQQVNLTATGQQLVFRQGERILTEISRKFDPQELALWFERLGFGCEEIYADPAELFGLLLLQKV